MKYSASAFGSLPQRSICQTVSRPHPSIAGSLCRPVLTLSPLQRFTLLSVPPFLLFVNRLLENNFGNVLILTIAQNNDTIIKALYNRRKEKTVKKSTKCTLFIAALGGVCIVSLWAAICVGSVHFSLNQIIKALFVDDGSPERLLIYGLRLPRALTGGLVGLCLSLSGCILQGVMRNTLASPSTVGVTSGASFVGYLTLAVFPAYSYLLPLGSILGALATTLLIYLLAYERGVSPVKMILSGMAVSALFGAFNDIIKTVFENSLGNVSGFLVGGLTGAVWNDFFTLLPFAVTGAVICAFLPTKMNVLMLGDESAHSLGLRVEGFRLFLIIVSSLLAGAAVSAAGLITFVGLIVPHVARLIVSSNYKYLFPASALLGFALVTLCDTLGRILMPPGEIPVGIILSLIGAPFFLWLLHKRGKESR